MINNFAKFKNIGRVLFIISAVGTTSVFTTSCSRDNVINLSPYNSISEDVAYSTPDMVKLSVEGMYNGAELGYYGNAPRGYPFGAAYFEQGDMRGEDMVSTATFYSATYQTGYNATGTLNNINFWIDSYKLINRTNLVIEGVTKAMNSGIISAADGNSYIGEAQFLRAATVLTLLTHFSRPYSYTSDASHLGVPYYLLPNNTKENIATNTALGRGTVAQCYKQILADLDNAEANTYSKAARSGNEMVSRVSKEAAIALKTRVYLNMRNWAKVISEANKLDGKYSLTANPSDPFVLASNLGNKESIFSIENSATNNPGVNAALASMYNGRALIAISPIIWDDPSWLVDDKRRAEGVMVNTVKGAKYTNKYKDVTNLSDASPYLRYAEVLLNRAEAKARMGDATFLVDLNAVRNRALANPTAQAYTVATLATPAAAVQAIAKERRIEFLAEGMRWNDISRLQNDDLAPVGGIPAKYANTTPVAADYHAGTPYIIKASDMAAIPATDYRLLWPIPAQEIGANPTIATQQNPGW